MYPEALNWLESLPRGFNMNVEKITARLILKVATINTVNFL